MSKELLHALESNGYIEFGSFIPGEFIRDQLGLVVPEIGTRKQFKDLELAELDATDYVRNVLLGRGMYLLRTGNDYRILLPSENAAKVESYIASATRKLNRSLKLTRNTPKTDMAKPDQTEARIMMKLHGVRQSFSARVSQDPIPMVS